jgi:acylphosphatase
VIRRRAIIRGRVQGVFFRDTLRQAAGREGVAGWARNCDDGSLEVALEGEPDAVGRMIDLCRIGPAAARIDQVEVLEEAPQGQEGFEVRH